MIVANIHSTRQVFIAPVKIEIKAEKKPAETTVLVQLIKSKSERGFTILYNKYSNALYNTMLKIVRNSDVADDLLQDTFVKIWKNIERFDPEKGTLFTWMLNIARNHAIDYLRSPACKNQLQNMSIDLFLLHHDSIGEATSNKNDLDFKDFKKKALQIDQKYAEVIDMIFFYGCTSANCAAVKFTFRNC